MISLSLDALLARIRERFEACFEQLDVDGQPLDVLTVQNMPAYLESLLARKALADPLRDLPLWAKIWPSSFVLGRYLRKLEPENRTLLEIGAGCGVTGCIAARYGFRRIVISDIVEDALLFAQANVLQNKLEERVEVRQVDVTATRLEERFDCIAASEILYLRELHQPLLDFLREHLALDGKAVFCTDLARRQDSFFTLAEQEFSVTQQFVGVRTSAENETAEHRVYALHTLERRLS